MTDEDRARAAMLGRGGGRCEICRGPGPIEASHRVGRAQGGPWVPPNILGLDHRCHAWLTEHRMVANAGGWILMDLPDSADVSTIPVWLNGAGLWPGWFTLDDRGDATPDDHDDPPILPGWVTT